MSEGKKLKGISGWLIVVAVGIVIYPIRNIRFIMAIPAIVSTGVWEDLTTQGSVAYHPLWAPTIIGEILINCGLLLVWFYVAYLFFMKSKHFPIWYICLADCYLLFMVVDIVVVKLFLTGKPILTLDTVHSMMGAVMMAVIGGPYMLVSKRVQATFITPFHDAKILVSQENETLLEDTEHTHHDDVRLSSESVLENVKCPRELNAGRAFGIFLGVLGGQILGAMALGMIIALLDPQFGRDLQHSRVVGQLSPSFIAIASLFGTIVGASVMFVLARTLGRHQLCDSNPTGAAWIRGSVKQLGLGFLLGVLVACFSLFVISWGFPVKDSIQPGPLTQLALTPGIAQISWILLAILIAPPVEELLFRGIILGGFSRSFGLTWGAIWTTSLFLLVHIQEVMHHWPTMIGVSMMALAALFIRLKTQTIGPAVALHLGYNAVIVSLVVIVTRM